MRYLYSLLIYLISPFILVYLKYRAKKNIEYNNYWHERFGFNLKNNNNKPIIWIHAVSVGETRAINELIYLFNRDYSNYQILLTNMTPTGRDTAKALYPNVILHYLPYDLPHAVINFYKVFNPKIALIVETEIWPNLIFFANKFNIPIYLINARLSNKSYKLYKKIKFFIGTILNNFTGILCQDQLSYNNFEALGYCKFLKIIGNTKFDLNLKQQNSINLVIPQKKVIIFASTRDGEEKLIIDNLPITFDYLVIIVPRHPERFKEVENLLLKKQLNYQRRSDIMLSINNNTQVLLVDSIGELNYFYTLSNIAIIGGSFSNCGGQNLIEPLFQNKPVIFGPSMFNFQTISEEALKFRCAIQVRDINECFEKINILLNNEEKYNELAINSKHFVNTYKGATKKIIEVIREKL